MKMLVLSVPHLSYFRGVERFIIEVSKRLSTLGFDITIATTCLNYNENKNKYVINDLGKKVTYIYRSTMSSLFLHIKNIVKEYDIVYYVVSYRPSDIVLTYLKQVTSNTKFIAGYISYDLNKFSEIYDKIALRTIRRVFDLNHVVNSYVANLLNRYGIRNIIKIPHGVDTNKFKPIISKKDKEKFNILYVGALETRKGIDILIKSMKILLANHKLRRRISFTIIGDGKFRDCVARLCRIFPSNIKYMPYVDDHNLIKMYNDAHVFVLPSRMETFCIAGLEALACGTPVILTNTPGPREYVNDKIGVLIKPNVTDLINAILYFLKIWYEDYGYYLKVCEWCRKEALKYDWGKICQLFYKVVSKIMSI